MYRAKVVFVALLQSAPTTFTWKKKPTEKVSKAQVPSANFRSRQIHPLVRVHRQPSVHLSESRATSLNSLLADSLESLNYEDRLVEETTERDALGQLYEDKEYLEFLLGSESMFNLSANSEKLVHSKTYSIQYVFYRSLVHLRMYDSKYFFIP